jgi:hypothetical protein
MIVSSPVFEAYLECPTKCWLRSRAEPAAGNAYEEWARAQNDAYYDDGLKRLRAMVPEAEGAIAVSITNPAKDATWRLATDVRLRTKSLEASLQAVERIPSEGRSKATQFIPCRFEFSNKLTKSDKLSLAFDGLVLSEVLQLDVNLGKIIHGDNHLLLKVKLSSLANEVQKHIKDTVELLARNSAPDLVLKANQTLAEKSKQDVYFSGVRQCSMEQQQC